MRPSYQWPKDKFFFKNRNNDQNIPDPGFCLWPLSNWPLKLRHRPLVSRSWRPDRLELDEKWISKALFLHLTPPDEPKPHPEYRILKIFMSHAKFYEEFNSWSHYLEVYQNRVYEGALASRSQEEYQRQLLQKQAFSLLFQKITGFIFLWIQAKLETQKFFSSIYKILN